MEDSSQSQHSEASPQPTPGPWHRCEAQPDAIVGPRCTEPCRICDDLQPKFGEDVPDSTYGDYFGGHFVCESVSSPENFNLIAAAPEILAVLGGVEEFLNGCDKETVLAAEERGVIRAMRSVAAKALGRQP